MSYLDKILKNIESTIVINERAESEKQRRWACAQTGKSRKKFKGKPSLSKKEAEKMCTDPLKEMESEVDTYFSDLLGEARVKDIKAKYPAWNKLGWIQWGRENLEKEINQKAVSKYLLYLIRELEHMFGVQEDANKGFDTDETAGDIRDIAEDLIRLIKRFEDNQARLKEKDIYKYSSSDLENTIKQLGLSSKEKDKSAKEGSEIVFENDLMFAVRPYTEEASCYYGKSTKWCISATESKNYFEEYTSRGKAFIMVLMKKLPERDVDRKIAIVFDDLGGFEEVYDAQDDQGSWTDLRDAVARNWSAADGAKLYSELEEDEQDEVDKQLTALTKAGAENIMDNPPEGEDIEERIEELTEEYPIENGDVGVDTDGVDGETYVMFSAQFQVEVSREKLLGLPKEREQVDELEAMLEKKIDNSLNIYPSMIEIYGLEEGYSTLYFNFEFSGDGYGATVEGYEQFLQDTQDIDKKYAGIQRVVALSLQELGYLKRGGIDALSDKVEDMAKQLTNFTITDNTEHVGDEDISFKSSYIKLNTEFVKQDLESIRDITSSYGQFTSPNINKLVQSRLGALNQKIISYLKKQLPLPGIPQAKLKELTIPEILEISFVDFGTYLTALIRIKIDDVDITAESATSIFEVVKFLDSEYDNIKKIVVKTVEDFIRKSKEGVRPTALPAGDDTEDDVFQEVREYFSEKSMSTLEKNIQKMTLKEWLDPNFPAPWDSDFEEYILGEGSLGKYVWPSANKSYDPPFEPDTKVEEMLYQQLHNHFGAIAPISDEAVVEIKKILNSGDYSNIFSRCDSGGEVQRGMRVSVSWIKKYIPEIVDALNDNKKDSMDWEPPISVRPFTYKPAGKFGNASSWTDNFKSARRFTTKWSESTIPIIIHSDCSSGTFMYTQAFDRYQKGRYEDDFGIKKLNPTNWSQEREIILFGDCEVTAVQINATKEKVMQLMQTEK